MHLNWEIPIGTIAMFGLQFVIGLVAILRAFAALEQSIDTRFNQISLELNTFKEGDIRDVQGRITRLEMGADEWTKVLRLRTDEHSKDLNDIRLKIDRLERPERYERRSTDPAREP